MRLWIDLANSPHVPFFRALSDEFKERGHEIELTARDFAQTVDMARQSGLAPAVIGSHGGGKLARKAGNLVGRALALARWARGRRIDLAVSHNSYTQVLAARALGLRVVTLMDYEHQPANHLAFRLASRVVVPCAFPEAALRRFGAVQAKTRCYDGTKEDVYLADFVPDSRFQEVLLQLGIEAQHVLVIARPPAREALYHRFDNNLFDYLLRRVCADPRVRLLLLPRTAAQREQYRKSSGGNVVVPDRALNGANLLAAADLVVSAGGTINREAAALGVPAATIYAGRRAAIDDALVGEGRLVRIETAADVDSLRLEKKPGINLRGARHVRSRVADLILEAWKPEIHVTPDES